MSLWGQPDVSVPEWVALCSSISEEATVLEESESWGWWELRSEIKGADGRVTQAIAGSEWLGAEESTGAGHDLPCFTGSL